MLSCKDIYSRPRASFYPPTHLILVPSLPPKNLNPPLILCPKMSFLITYSNFSRIVYLPSSVSLASDRTGSNLQKAPNMSSSSSSAPPPSSSSANAKKHQPKTKLRGKALRRAVCSGTAHRVLIVPSMADLVATHTIREHMVSNKSTKAKAAITTTTTTTSAAVEGVVKDEEGLKNASSSTVCSVSQAQVPSAPGTTTPAPSASGLKKMKRWGIMQSGSAKRAQQLQLSGARMEEVRREAEALRFGGMRRVWAEGFGPEEGQQEQQTESDASADATRSAAPMLVTSPSSNH